MKQGRERLMDTARARDLLRQCRGMLIPGEVARESGMMSPGQAAVERPLCWLLTVRPLPSPRETDASGEDNDAPCVRSAWFGGPGISGNEIAPRLIWRRRPSD